MGINLTALGRRYDYHNADTRLREEAFDERLATCDNMDFLWQWKRDIQYKMNTGYYEEADARAARKEAKGRSLRARSSLPSQQSPFLSTSRYTPSASQSRLPTSSQPRAAGQSRPHALTPSRSSATLVSEFPKTRVGSLPIDCSQEIPVSNAFGSIFISEKVRGKRRVVEPADWEVVTPEALEFGPPKKKKTKAKMIRCVAVFVFRTNILFL